MAGGTIAPGLAGAPSLFTVGSLDLASGGVASFGIVGAGSLAGTAGTDYDQLRITGSSAAAGSLRLDFSNSGAFATGQVFELFKLDAATPVGHFSSVIAAGSGVYSSLSFSRSGGDSWTSTFTSDGQLLRFDETTGRLVVMVPEPSTWGMLVAGGAVGGFVRSRRRRQKMLGM